MSELPNVAPGEIIASSHINDIKDRAVMRYTNAAERDALNPTPQQGDVAFLEDVNALQIYYGGGWGSRYNAGGGSAAVPAFNLGTAQTEGMYQPSAGQIGFSTGGVKRFDMGPFGLRGVDNGAPVVTSVGGVSSAPAYSFFNDPTTGMYRSGALQVALVADGTIGIELRAAGDVRMTRINDWPTSLDANMQAGSSGRLAVSTSARRFKSNIQPLTPDDVAAELKPVRFWSDLDDATFVGFVAEDVVDAVPNSGVYTDDGEVLNYDTRSVVAILAAKVNALTARVEALEG